VDEMIKKDLKTLSEVQNPKKNVWKIHLDDGTFIDTDDETRDRIIFNLHRRGEFLHGEVRVTPMQVAQNIELTFNVQPTQTEENLSKGRKFWNMFKEDVLYFNKATTIFLTFVSVIVGFLTYTTQYFVNGPFKNMDGEVMTFLPGAFYWIGVTSLFAIGFCQIKRVWNLLAYITCWFKFLAFIIFAILLLFTVGFISERVVDKIADFVGKRIATKREHKITETILT